MHSLPAIDDAPSMRMMGAFTLSGANFNVVEGQDALENAPIHALIIHTDSRDRMSQPGEAAGATGWQEKPFDPGRLIKPIWRVMR